MIKKICFFALAVCFLSKALAQTDDVNVPLLDDDSVTYVVVEKDPEFPGGTDAMYQYILSNTKYADTMLQCSGSVFVSFIIESDGSISNAKLVRDIGCGCGDEALRVVNSMPRWKPGKIHGKKVRVQYILPILFGKKE